MLTLEMAIQKIQQLPPEQRNKVIEFVEFLEFQSSRSFQQQSYNIVENPKISFTEATKEFIGCLDSDIEDLSHNPQYLEGLGQP